MANRPASSLGAALASALPAVVTTIVLVVVWEILVTVTETPAYIIPAPSRIWEALFTGNSSLSYHTMLTGFESLAGFVIGSALGAMLGIVFAYSRFVARSLMPYVIASNTIPVVAVAPIIMLWFGAGIGSKVAVTAFLSFFPLALNMMKGLQSYDRTVMEVFHVAAATPLQRFFKMRVPSAMPYIFVGLKLNVTFSVIGAIVAEFVQADRGLGFVIMTAYRTLNMPRLWAAMLASALLGILLFVLVAAAERLVIPWHSSMREVK
ncbi:ABC transporter permease [Zavarzinia sp.]|uniref:ABC transporter permease n=1 Tax=Zavarzinia sp. TaxID=2027920 RepID=UPI0035620221